MAILQGELSNSNGYVLTGTYIVFATEINSNGYWLDAVSNLVGESSNGVGTTASALLQCLSDLSASNGYGLSTISVLTPQLNSSIGQYQQYLSRLARFFGENAKQTATQIQINKADLGIQPLTNSTAESLFVALLLRGLQQNNNSILSDVYFSLFNRYVEPGNPPTLVTSLVISLYAKAVYESRISLAFDKVMIDYSTIVKPNDYTP